jgi:hypothetical protein
MSDMKREGYLQTATGEMQGYTIRSAGASDHGRPFVGQVRRL